MMISMLGKVSHLFFSPSPLVVFVLIFPPYNFYREKQKVFASENSENSLQCCRKM